MRIIRILDRRGISIKQEEILDYLEPQRENLFYHEFYNENPSSDTYQKSLTHGGVPSGVYKETAARFACMEERFTPQSLARLSPHPP